MYMYELWRSSLFYPCEWNGLKWDIEIFFKKKKIKRELRWIMEIEFIRVGIKFLFLTEDKEIKILGGNICINNILFVNVGF